MSPIPAWAVNPVTSKQACEQGHSGGMGIMDTVKNFLAGHDKEVDQVLGKAGNMAKTRFGGHDSQIDGLVGQARQHTGGGDTTTPATTNTPASTTPTPPTGSGPVEGQQTPSTGPTPQQ